jgi:hypothetical protein
MLALKSNHGTRPPPHLGLMGTHGTRLAAASRLYWRAQHTTGGRRRCDLKEVQRTITMPEFLV